MSEPATEAGRRLLAEIDRRNFEAEPFNTMFGPKDDWLAQALAQVEQEARSDLAARIVAAVEGLGNQQRRVDEATGYAGWDFQKAIARCLDAIREASDDH